MEITNYKSLDEKRAVFSNRYKVINTLSDFITWYDVIINEKKQKKMFRGQHEAKFKNYTSAQRRYKSNDLATSGVSLKTLIQTQIDKLAGLKPKYKGGVHKNLLRRYYDSLGVIPNDLLFLSFAQHYHGISPLLDFTRNLNVALYFMTADADFPSGGGNDIDNYVSVYYLPVDDYKQEFTEKKIPREEIIDIFSFDKMSESSPMIIPDKKITINEEKGFAFKSFISFSNLNIILQEGGFVFYFNKDKGKELQPLEQELYCVDIHKSLIPYIKDNILKKNNISKVTLFPEEEKIVKLSLDETLKEVVL